MNPAPVDLSLDTDPERLKTVTAALAQLGGDYQTPVSGPTIDLGATEPTSPPEPSPSPAGDAVPTTPHFCPCCGWDGNRPYPEDPTPEDKFQFLLSCESGGRFRKTYDVLNGRSQLTFRTLSSEEADLCLKQAAYDAQDGQILNAGQYFQTMADYTLSLSLAGFKNKDRDLVLPELRGYDDSKLPPLGARETKLRRVVPYVYQKVLVTDSLRKVAGVVFARFSRLVELFEKRALDPNFWPRTGSRP
jgi:hypothetical protein